MTSQARSICSACKLRRMGPADRPTCTAFPAGIPDAIWGGGFDHRLPFPGDGGTRFVRDPDAPLPPGYPERVAAQEPVFLADPGEIRTQTRRELRETAKNLIAGLRDHPERPL